MIDEKIELIIDKNLLEQYQKIEIMEGSDSNVED